jgi:hypothetical protein
VTIYAKERPPYVRSARATGAWTPDSRVALTSAVAPDFGAAWEKMARISFAMYQSYLGAAGTPIEWTDRYMLHDEPSRTFYGDSHGFVDYGDRLSDITPGTQQMPSGSTPFPTASVRRTTTLTFNVASYSRQLVEEFQIGGGHIETREFHTPTDLAGIAYHGLNVLARRDGIVIQPMPKGDDTGWNDANEEPDRAEAEAGVRTLQDLYARMATNRRSG